MKGILTFSRLTLFWIIISSIPIVVFAILQIHNSVISEFEIQILQKHNLKILIFNGTTITLICLPLLIFSVPWVRYYNLFIGLIIIPPTVIDTLHTLIFAGRINPAGWYALFSTRSSEAVEFSKTYISTDLLIWLAIIVAIVTALYFLFKTKSISIVWFSLVLVVLVNLAFLSFRFTHKHETYWNESTLSKTFLSYQSYRNEIRNLKECANIQNKLATPNRKPVSTHIILIGESTSRYHLSLYGYHRNTTPHLDSLKTDLIIFNNAISPIVHTIKALQSAFKSSKCNTYISELNSKGFETLWISNQLALGEDDTPIAVIANTANTVIYSSVSGTPEYDGVLIDLLKKSINPQKSQVIFLHLMGTHLSYYERYPSEFNYFDSIGFTNFGTYADQQVNQYDNAILYDDYLISEVIKIAKDLSVPTSVTYFSDHGDEVYDFRNFQGHTQVRLSNYMTDIPLIIYRNQKLNNVDPIAQTELDSIRNAQIDIGDLSVLLNVNFGLDTLSRVFLPPKNEIKEIVSAQRPYRKLPEYTDKIWVHRTNSVQRFEEVKDDFNGMEVDLTYQNGVFDINHPGNKSIGLSLQEMFSKIENPSGYYWWFDYKNLDSLNIDSALNRLINVLPANFNTDHILFETIQPNLIPQIEKKGFYASYYLPDLSSMNDSIRSKTIEEIIENIDKYHVSTLSAGIDNYEFMRSTFPDMQKAIWILTMDWNPENADRINNILSRDSTIKVCLVNYHTKSWR